MPDVAAVCIRCGARKDLPLGRCPACRHLPEAAERELSVLASARVLGPAELAEVEARIRRGERLNPSAAVRAKARAVLAGAAEAPAALAPGQMAALLAANVLLTPLLGLAVWFRWRTRPGPGAKQALWVTIPVSVALAAAWIGWIAWRAKVRTGG